MKKYLTIGIFFAFVCSFECYSQDRFTSTAWLLDDLTIAFKKGEDRKYLSGIRLLIEPQFGGIITSADNRMKVDLVSAFPKFGIETNLLQGWISFQATLIYPGSIEFDDQSPVLTQNLILTTDKKVNVNFGYGLGLSCLDGIFAFGFGHVQFDKRDFDRENILFKDNYLKSGFFFFNLQPVSGIRKLIKLTRTERQARLL